MADRIKRERLRHGEDPVDTAYAIKVDKRTLERWESGERVPQLRHLRELANHWNVEITDLRPDLEAEERQLREQLDRIEAKLDTLLAAIPSPQKRATGAAQTAAQRSRQRKTGSRGSTGVRKKAAGQ